MRRFFHISFLGLNLIFLVPLLLAHLSMYVSPVKIWFLPFFGISFILWVAIQVVFIVVWAIRKRWHALISLAALLLSWNQVTTLIQFHTPISPNPEGSSFKVLSYNVRLFNLYNWNKRGTGPSEMVKFMEELQPDIVCLQEFLSSSPRNARTFDTLPGNRNMYHGHTRTPFRAGKRRYYGLAIFSRFPIVQRGEIPFQGSQNQCIWTDLEVHNDTIRVYNVHLQSVYFGSKQYQFLDNFELKYDDRNVNGSLDILRLMKRGYQKRARQADLVSASIQSCPYPVVVCGDFNDTPVSYAYHSIKNRNNLLDAFEESGSGLGSTFTGLLPDFRIDYILYDARLKSLGFQREKVKFSDHFPVHSHLEKSPEGPSKPTD